MNDPRPPRCISCIYLITPDQQEWLRTQAFLRNVSMSWLIRDAIDRLRDVKEV